MKRLEKSQSLFAYFAGIEIIAVFILGLISISRPSFLYDHLENFSLSRSLATVAVFTLLLINYLVLICFFQKFPTKKLLGLFVVAVTFLVLIPPFASRDIFSYLNSAKNLFSYGQNPYLNNIGYLLNPWFVYIKDIWWSQIKTPYGPLFQLLAVIPVIFFHSNLLWAVFAYKLLNLVFFLGGGYLLYLIILNLGFNKKTIFLYLLNPAILINGVLEGHNEIMMIFFVLLAIYLLLYKKNTSVWSLPSLLAAVLIKYTPIVIAPVWINSFVRTRNDKKWKPIIASLIISTIFFFLIFWCFGFPVKQIISSVRLQSEIGCFYSCAPVVTIANYLSPRLSNAVLIIVGLTSYFAAFYLFLIKKSEPLKFVFWSLFSVLIVVKWLSPWYPLLLLPLAVILFNTKTYRNWLIFLTFYSLLHYFGL